MTGLDTHNLNNFKLSKYPYNFHTYCPLFEDITYKTENIHSISTTYTPATI